jgi:hypothetical protein
MKMQKIPRQEYTAEFKELAVKRVTSWLIADLSSKPWVDWRLHVLFPVGIAWPPRPATSATGRHRSFSYPSLWKTHSKAMCGPDTSIRRLNRHTPSNFRVPRSVENAGKVPVTIWLELNESDWECVVLDVFSECTPEERGPRSITGHYAYRVMRAQLADSAEPYLQFTCRLYNPPAALGVAATLKHRTLGAERILYNKSITMRYDCVGGCPYFGIERINANPSGP